MCVFTSNRYLFVMYLIGGCRFLNEARASELTMIFQSMCCKLVNLLIQVDPDVPNGLNMSGKLPANQ